jgi:hypothetical protein
MQRVAHKSRGFIEADEWDIRQQRAMTPMERMRAGRELKNRLHSKETSDVRLCRQATKKK